MDDVANVQSLLAMGDKTPVLTPVQGILFHGESKSGGDFWALKDNNKNTIYVKFWNCEPPNIPLKGERVVTLYPDLAANKHKATIKVTIFNGKAGLNVNSGYRTDMDSAPPPDSRPETEGNDKLAYQPGAPVGIGDSAQARTRQIALYRLLCDNTVLITHGDKGYTPELLKDISTSVFIQGTRMDLHLQMKDDSQDEDVPF